MNLGLVYQGVLAFLAVWVAMATSGFLLEHSVAASLLSSDAALPGPEDPASSIPLYLIYLGLSLVLATAPAWGFFYRFEAAAVLPGSLKRFGTLLGMGGLAMAVVSAPVCIAVDGSLRTQLGELFQNEPYHYFVSAGKT